MAILYVNWCIERVEDDADNTRPAIFVSDKFGWTTRGTYRLTAFFHEWFEENLFSYRITGMGIGTNPRDTTTNTYYTFQLDLEDTAAVAFKLHFGDYCSPRFKKLI